MPMPRAAQQNLSCAAASPSGGHRVGGNVRSLGLETQLLRKSSPLGASQQRKSEVTACSSLPGLSLQRTILDF